MYSNIAAMLMKRAEELPMKKIFTFLSYENDITKEKNITYSELFNKAREVAVYLSKRGIEKGDRIIIFSTQTYDNIYSIFGALLTGAIFVLIPPPIDRQKQERLKSVLSSSGAKCILCNESMYHAFKNILGENLLANVSIINENLSLYTNKQIADNDLAYLQYSSGSTSNPKGVVISHKNIMSNLHSIDNFFLKHPIYTMVGWIPYFHNVGLAGQIFFSIQRNYRMVFISTNDFLQNPIRWLKAIENYKAEITAAPDSAYRLLSRIVKDNYEYDFDLSSLKYAINGGEVVSINTIKEFSEKFAKFGFNSDSFCPGYGLSESTYVVSCNDREPTFMSISSNNLVINGLREINDEQLDTKYITGMGKLMGNVKCIIVNPKTLKECKSYEVGEIWIQSDSVADGYWNLEDETNKTFRATIDNQPGFFLRTGDMGLIHNNHLYVTGRIKDIIIINGNNIYPQDIDEALKRNLSFLNYSTICSFSINSNEKERVILIIEANNEINYSVAIEEISKILQREFEFSPFDIVFVKVGSLSRSDNGKIQTFKIKENYEKKQLEILFDLRDFKECENALTRDKKDFDEIEKFIEQTFKTILEIHTDLLENSNFFELGGDSLDTMHLVCMIEEKYKFRIDIKEIIDDLSITSIAQYIRSKLNCQNSQYRIAYKKALYEDCSLDESIRPVQYENFDREKIKNIFITGATGFVGAYLIKDLLGNTKASVFCHVRAENIAHGLERIKNNLKHYECWQDSYESRIIPVLGDLSKPLLGIDEIYFNKLGDMIDSIYHNGALLNFVFPYSHLKNTNVQGTIECLRLACKGKPKYFNYISTFSVFDNPSHFKTIAYEDDNLENPDGYFLGYTETKWVSEKLIRIAENRGLKVCIYRPGDITGSSTNGIWEMNDLVSRVLVSCINMGKVPDTDVKIYMTPVDYVSKAIVYLSLKESSFGKAFNLVNKNIGSVKDLVHVINEYGFDVSLLPYEEWQQILFGSNENNVLKVLECLFVQDGSTETSIIRRFSDMEADFDITNVAEGLKDSDIQCPPVNQELLYKYLDYFKSRSYI